jgi:ubiquinone/menaquinone biosynthesis C-methylase UbiE
VCRNPLTARSSEQFVCEACGENFLITNGIPNFLPQNIPTSTLEKIDYDKIYQLNPKVITSIGKQWDELIRKIGMEGGDAIEIGSGTGALTLGLLEMSTFRSLVATDISFKFLDGLRARSLQYHNLSMAMCDANHPNFRDEVFDVVLGRSILHHLVDYQLTLQSAFNMLRPDGVALFFEPVIQGKIFIALFARLLVESDNASGTPILTSLEKNKITAYVRALTKQKWYPQSRESLLKIEDKYIFNLQDLLVLARSIGYAECSFVNSNESIDATYWNYFIEHMRVIGIDHTKLSKHCWIGKAFSETYGLIFANELVAPMGFFVFRK